MEEKKTNMLRSNIWIIAAAFLSTVGIIFSFGRYDSSGNNLWLFLLGVCTVPAWIALIVMIVKMFRLPAESKGMSTVSKAALSVIAGLVAMFLSGNMADKEYDYIVNGIRMSDAAENISGKIAVFFITGVILFAVLSFISGAVCRLKSVSGAEIGRGLILLAGTGAAVAAGILLMSLLSGVSSSVITEQEFLADPGKVRRGKIIEFGQYRQNGTEYEPIRWEVVKKKNGEMILMSKYALDYRCYNNPDDDWMKTKVDWEDCALRKWLGSDFAEEAFSEEERALLVPVDIGGGASDLVTLLTEEQADDFFGEYAACPVTENVAAVAKLSKGGDCEWLLRPSDKTDTTIYEYMFAELYTSHTMYYESFSSIADLRGIRPVVVISY